MERMLAALDRSVGEGTFTGSGSLKCGEPGRLDDAIERAHNRVVRDLGTTGGLLHLYGGEPFPRSGYYHYSIERVGADIFDANYKIPWSLSGLLCKHFTDRGWHVAFIGSHLRFAAK